MKNNPTIDLKILADTTTKQTNIKNIYGSSGLVPKTNQDGGLAIAAAKLKKSEISPVIKSTQDDGYYYYVIRLSDSNTNQVNYEYIKIPVTTFTDSLEKLIKNGKVSEYISIPKEKTSK